MGDVARGRECHRILPHTEGGKFVATIGVANHGFGVALDGHHDIRDGLSVGIQDFAVDARVFSALHLRELRRKRELLGQSGIAVFIQQLTRFQGCQKRRVDGVEGFHFGVGFAHAFGERQPRVVTRLHFGDSSVEIGDKRRRHRVVGQQNRFVVGQKRHGGTDKTRHARPIAFLSFGQILKPRLAISVVLSAFVERIRDIGLEKQGQFDERRPVVFIHQQGVGGESTARFVVGH